MPNSSNQPERKGETGLLHIDAVESKETPAQDPGSQTERGPPALLRIAPAEEFTSRLDPSFPWVFWFCHLQKHRP